MVIFVDRSITMFYVYHRLMQPSRVLPSNRQNGVPVYILSPESKDDPKCTKNPNRRQNLNDSSFAMLSPSKKIHR